jgi:NUMOD3 motif
MDQVTVENNLMQVRFGGQFDLQSYNLFLKCKKLPEFNLDYDYEHDNYTITAPARFASMLQIEQADYLRPDQGSVFIYTLIDPLTNSIRYIGQSIRPMERLTNHCNDKSECHRTHWIQSLLKQEMRPLLLVLDCVASDDDWRTVERDWIAYGRERGWSLTNGTDGGDGTMGLSAESRARIRAAWIGRKHSPESRIKIGAASRGRKHTEEFKQRLSARFKDRSFSQQTRSKISRRVRKLSNKQVREARMLLAETISHSALRPPFGVDPKTIGNIKHGTYYADVE